MAACYFCGTSIDPGQKILREASCASCGRDLHACVQCRHYDPNAHNKCREPQAEWVTDKDKANFCEFFEFRETSALTQPGLGGAQSSQDRARAALDSLFKKT